MSILHIIFSQPGIDQLDLELLIAHILKKDRSFVMAHPEHKLTKRQLKKLLQLVERRKNHEPLAYLIGQKEFYGLSFFVNHHTLIPRPETEILVEQALHYISSIRNPQSLNKHKKSKRVVVIDVGTGSGCIIIALVKHLLHSNSHLENLQFKFFATDISSAALEVARKNAYYHQIKKYINFKQGNLLAPFSKKFSGFDEIIILANLPYLSSTLYHSASQDVRQYEPKTALFSRNKGLSHYQCLLNQIKYCLPRKKVYFFLEISPEQTTHLDFLPAEINIFSDFSGRARLVCGTLHSQ